MADGRQNPRCGKCGRSHYGFQPCPDPTEGSMRAREIVRQPRGDGLKDWRTSTRTVTAFQSGNGVVVRQPRTTIDTGRVTDSDHRPVALPRLPKPKPTLTYPKGVNNDG